eukprot:2272353-Pleurochrysis_carterae.AAC.1
MRRKKEANKLTLRCSLHVFVNGIAETQISFVHASGRCAPDLMLAVQAAGFAKSFPGEFASVCEKQHCRITSFVT